LWHTISRGNRFGVFCARYPPSASNNAFASCKSRRIKSLGEPAIDRCQQVVRLLALALALPQVTQAGGGPQLPGFGLLEAGFGLRRVRGGLLQQHFILEPIQLRLIAALPCGIGHRQRPGQHGQRLFALAPPPIYLGERSEITWSSQLYPTGSP